VRLRLAMSPWWVQGLAYGVLFGVGMTVFSRFQLGEWGPAVLGGVVGGALFGLVMGRFMSRVNQRMLSGLEDLGPGERRTVLRGSWRGAVPTDPGHREAARALLQRQRDATVRTLRWSIAVFAGGIVLYVVLALTRTGWWWLGAVLFAGFLAWTLAAPARMDRRLALLRSSPDGLLRSSPDGPRDAAD
jgi:hypothetical protein